MVNVTKAFLPPLNEYVKYLEGIWERCHLTNHGPLVNELEEKLKEILGVKHLFFVSNGTIALQIALKALDIQGEVITTPFSYVATTSAIAWENCLPVFVDINPRDFTIDVDLIEAAITPHTQAILATHVFGIPCAVKKIQEIASKHQLKVIYDAAHAFGVRYDGTSILNYGDISTLSFHATKLFHTTEGGAIVTNDDDYAHRISYMRNFGHKGQEDFWGIGINGKNSEFHAAMGLSVMPYLGEIFERREYLSKLYDRFLADLGLDLQRPDVPQSTDYNYAYYPVLFASEKNLLTVKDALNALHIFPRRYFYPSLNTLPYVKNMPLYHSEDVANRVLCLPFYHELKEDHIKLICRVIDKAIKFG